MAASAAPWGCNTAFEELLAIAAPQQEAVERAQMAREDLSHVEQRLRSKRLAADTVPQRLRDRGDAVL